MPSITDDFIDKHKKKFKKKNYRPWDDLPDFVSESRIVENQKEEKIDSLGSLIQKNIEEKSKIKIDDLSERDREILLKSLFGVQKNVAIYLVNNIVDVDNFLTSPISKSDIIQYTKSSSGTVGMSLFRLQEKGLIKISYFKRGIGAFSIFQINKFLCDFFKK